MRPQSGCVKSEVEYQNKTQNVSEICEKKWPGVQISSQLCGNIDLAKFQLNLNRSQMLLSKNSTIPHLLNFNNFRYSKVIKSSSDSEFKDKWISQPKRKKLNPTEKKIFENEWSAVWYQLPVPKVPAAPEAVHHPLLHGRAHHGRALPPHLPCPEHRYSLTGS